MTKLTDPAELIALVNRKLIYERSTGLFLSRGLPNQRAKGLPVGSLNDGYVRIKLLGHYYSAHILVWVMENGQFSPSELDHRDRNKAHNQIDNLRLSGPSTNRANTEVHENNKTGYKGVSPIRGGSRCKAQIQVNGKVKHLGCFDDPLMAHRAYCAAAREYFGEFASTPQE